MSPPTDVVYAVLRHQITAQEQIEREISKMNREYFTQIRQTLELFKIQIEMMEELLYMAQDAYRISEKKRECAERGLEYWKERAERLPNVES